MKNCSGTKIDVFASVKSQILITAAEAWESQWQRPKPAVNLSSGPQQLSGSRMCHVPPDTASLWLASGPGSQTHALNQSPALWSVLASGSEGSSGASFGPRDTEANQGVSIADGGEM